MKERRWLFVVLAALSLILASCGIAPPTVDVPSSGLRTSDGELELSGTGLGGYEVQVVVDGQVLGVTQVGEDGTWSLDVTFVKPGEQALTVQTLSRGYVVGESAPVSVSVAGVMETAQASTAPVIEPEPVEGSVAGDVAPEGDEAETAAPATAVTTPPELLFPIDGADVIVGRLTLIGPGQPGAGVEILDGSAVLGTTQVGADGEWRYTFEPQAGAYQFAVRSGGDTTTPEGFVEVRVTSDEKSIDCFSNPGIDRGEVFVVGTCDTLEDISKLKGISLEDLEAANSQLEDPDMVYPGEFITIP
jgi:hypothetical protein